MTFNAPHSIPVASLCVSRGPGYRGGGQSWHVLGLECEASKLRVGGRDLRGHRDSWQSVDTRQEFTKYRGTAARDRGPDVTEVSRRSAAEGQKHGRRPAEGTVTSACACGHVAGAHCRTCLGLNTCGYSTVQRPHSTQIKGQGTASSKNPLISRPSVCLCVPLSKGRALGIYHH